MKTRKGIALIELIFAMVIIAITLLSVPNLISQTTKSSNQAITQEAISNAASELDMIMSSFWDENCTIQQRFNPVLVVDFEAPGLEEMNVTIPTMPSAPTIPTNHNSHPTHTTITKHIGGKRVGSPINSARRFLTDINGTRYSATNPNNLGLDNNETQPDDVDDFNGTVINLVSTPQIATATEGDYKDQKIKLSIEVSYINDTPSTGYNTNIVNFNNPFANENNISSTNIKKIELTLTSENDPNKKVVLKSFSCNIGSGTLEEKIF